MKSSSSFIFFWRNKKKFLTLFIPMTLSIILIYFIEMVIVSFVGLSQRAAIEPYRHFSSLSAKTNVIKADTINSILAQKYKYQKVMPWLFEYTNIDTIGTKVITVKSADLKLLMKKMNLKLIKGRLPQNNKNEIILHKTVAANKKLKIGQKIGSKIQPNEALQGERVIVGIIDGRCLVSFSPLEYWMKENKVFFDDYSTGMLLLPIGNNMEKFNFLKTDDLQGIDCRNLDIVVKQTNQNLKGINFLISVIDLMVIIIVTLCTSFISYIYFIHRKYEYGILLAMGLTNQGIIIKAFKEMILLNCLAFIFGVLFSVSLGWVINTAFLNTIGLSLLLVKQIYLVKVGIIPVLTIITSLLPIWKILKDLDPLTIIEGMS